MSGLLDALLEAIDASGKTHYRIAKDADVSPSQLSRLASGERGVSVETVERLAKALGYDIVLKRQRRKAK